MLVEKNDHFFEYSKIIVELNIRYTHIIIKCFIILSILLLFGIESYAEGVRVIDNTRSLQAQFSSTDMIYVIKNKCDLKGGTIVLPQGSIIRFDGGKLENGTISNSSFVVEASRTEIFKNVIFSSVNEDYLHQVNHVFVSVLCNDTFYSVETNSLVRKGDLVNNRSIYRICSPSKTILNEDGTRKVIVDGTEYQVSDIHGNYTYPTRSIIGIDKRTGKMLQSEVIDVQYEVFYKIVPLQYINSSVILNREIYPEWFGCKANAKEDQSDALNYCVGVASESRSLVLMSSGKYTISKPLIAKTNTKIIGVDSSPWNVCTNVALKTSKGIIVFDEKGCNNVLLEGLSFSPESPNFVEKYIGIEVRTSMQGMILKNISCYQPEIGIYLNAYSDLLSASIDNYKQLAGVYGIVMQPLFKTTFKSSYCNGNSINIGTGGSSLLKKNVIYVKNCEGNNISYNAGEQYGNPSVYCDNSIISISGLSWHEESVFLQAVNHSRVTIVGEIYALGVLLSDKTSTISFSNIKNSYHWHSVINPNYHPIDFDKTQYYKLDVVHRSFLENNGNVVFEIDKNKVRYVNGNPYCIIDSNNHFSINYDKARGVTIFLRLCSSGAPINPPVLSIEETPVFVLSSSSLFSTCCIVSALNDKILGYLTQGESILSFCINNDSVFFGNQYVGHIYRLSDKINLKLDSFDSTSLMVSDLLCVEGVISDEVELQEYEHYLAVAPPIEIPKAGFVRPRLTKNYKGFCYFDEKLGYQIVWNGDNWVTTSGTIIN